LAVLSNHTFLCNLVSILFQGIFLRRVLPLLDSLELMSISSVLVDILLNNNFFKLYLLQFDLIVK
jgi:hypothetical protein